jgi:uncharacterized protein
MTTFRVDEKFKPKVIIMGFRGIGQVGYLSIRYLIDKLGADRKGIIESLYAQPVILVDKDKLSYPIEIYGWRDVGIIRIEEISIDKHGAYLIREIVKWLKQNDIEKIILIGGLVSTLKEDEDDIARIATNSYWKEEANIRYTQKDVRILGPLAYALYFSEIYALPALAILAYANSESPVDPRGAYYALETLKKFLDIDVDTSELLKTATEVEEKIAELIEELNENKNKGIYT